MENTEITLITIKKNTFEFNKTLHISDRLLLTEEIKSHLLIKQVKFCDMMESIVLDIGLTPELIGESPVIFDTSSNVYQLCFVGIEKHPSSPQDTINSIATYLTGERVYGNVVFLNSKITSNGTCIPDNSQIDDLVDILVSKFVHKAIFIPHDTSQQVSEFTYQTHPLEYFESNEENYKNYTSYEFDIIGFGLCLFTSNNSNDQNINKRATCLLGKQKLYGNTLLLLKSANEYYDLDKTTYSKLFKISHAPLSTRKLTQDEEKQDEKINGLPIVKNKYCILENRYSNYKNRCGYCNVDLTKELTCTGCYRIKYHDEKCQQSDWFEHKKECLHTNK
jgi:hypothetical protein